MGRLLREQEKVKALLMESPGNRISEIAKELERPQSTIRSFLKTYKSRGTLKPPEKDRRIVFSRRKCDFF
jgi:transposase-like protein